MNHMTPRLRTAIGIVVLILLLCLWAVVIDEKCSRNLDYNDILWEDLVPRPVPGHK